LRLPFDEFIKIQNENKVTKIDFVAASPHIYIDSEKCLRVNDVQNSMNMNGISVYSLTPLPYRFSICANGGTIQHKKTIDYYKQCILVGKELGSKYICVTGSGANYDENPEYLIDNAIESLSILAEYAKNNDITVLLGTVFGDDCIINASTPVLVSAADVKKVTECVDSKNLKVYMDTEVISVCGESIREWFELFGKDIRLIRFTDGNYNGYRVWGKGCLPCRKYVDTIQQNGYDGYYSMQIPGEKYFENPVEADKENLKYLYEIFEQVN